MEFRKMVLMNLFAEQEWSRRCIEETSLLSVSSDLCILDILWVELHNRWPFVSDFCQFSSVSQLCPTLCDPMDYSTPGLPVHHQLPEFTQTHVHWVSYAIQLSHPLSFPSPPTFSLSQHQGLYKWVSTSHQVVKVLEFQLQHQSFQWTPRTVLL